jgi:hypothetical protein
MTLAATKAPEASDHQANGSNKIYWPLPVFYRQSVANQAAEGDCNDYTALNTLDEC